MKFNVWASQRCFLGVTGMFDGCFKAGVTCQELQVKSDKSIVTSQELQVKLKVKSQE